MAARGVFFEMDHPVIGMARFEGNADAVLARRVPENWRSAPLLGEDNAYVFTGHRSGIDEDEYDELTSEGII